jgi:predicted membrane protein
MSIPASPNPFASPEPVDSGQRATSGNQPTGGIAFLRYWLVLSTSIALSGGTYGVIVATALLTFNRQDPRMDEEFGLIFFGGAVGGIVAGFVAGPVVMLACLVYFFMQTSRRAPLSLAVRLFADTFCGAACGAISILSFIGDVGLENREQLLLMGAIVMGGVGGAFASIVLSWHHPRRGTRSQ